MIKKIKYNADSENVIFKMRKCIQNKLIKKTIHFLFITIVSEVYFNKG